MRHKTNGAGVLSQEHTRSAKERNVRLIRAVELYDPDNKAGKTLKGYIFMSLRFALRTCSSSQTQYGFREAPHFLPNAVISMEALEDADPYWEMRIAA